MAWVTRDGVKLYYEQHGHGDQHVVFVHGWACDHTFFGPLLDHFAGKATVTTLDLRGCGASDRPEGGYDVASFADDVAHLCREVGATRPVIVGHSFGGIIGVEMGARHPSLPGAIVGLDPGPIHTTPLAREVFEGLASRMEGPDGEAVWRAFVDSPTLAGLEAERAQWIIDTMCAVPIGTVATVIREIARWDGAAALALCRAPLLVIVAQPGGSNDPARLREVKPDIRLGMTVGAGHFHQFEVADQLIPMIERFLAADA